MTDRSEAILASLVSYVEKQKEISSNLEKLQVNEEIEDALQQQFNAIEQSLQQLTQSQNELYDFVIKKNEQESEPTQTKEDNNEVSETNQNWGTSVDTAWTTEKSGGCMNHPTWRQNPQILLKVVNEGEMTVHLTQNPSDDQENEGIGFYVFNGCNYKELITTNGAAVARSSFSRNETISCTFSLPPTADGYVCLLLTVFHLLT